MAQQDTKLPEGTDKITDGAMDTTLQSSPTAEQFENTGAVAATGNESGQRDASGNVGIDSDTGNSGSASGLIDRVRNSGGKISGQAADKARGLVGQGLERGADALANVGRLVGETADGLDERLGEEYGDYARRAAGAIENAASSIASKDADELIDDTRQFIRKSPGVALAGAAIVGFAVARLLKSGLSGDDSERDGGGRKRS